MEWDDLNVADHDAVRPDTFRRRIWPIYVVVIVIGSVLRDTIASPAGNIVLFTGLVVGVVGLGREVVVGYRGSD